MRQALSRATSDPAADCLFLNCAIPKHSINLRAILQR